MHLYLCYTASPNPKYEKVVQEEIQKFLDIGFIYEIKHTEWVSPIVIINKKNGKIRVCVNLKKVNAAMRKDHYSLPFTDFVKSKDSNILLVEQGYIILGP